MFRNVWARSDAVRQARYVKDGRVWSRYGRRGTPRLGAFRQGAVRFGEDGHGWAGEARLGAFWFGKLRLGKVWRGRQGKDS